MSFAKRPACLSRRKGTAAASEAWGSVPTGTMCRLFVEGPLCLRGGRRQGSLSPYLVVADSPEGTPHLLCYGFETMFRHGRDVNAGTGQECRGPGGGG